MAKGVSDRGAAAGPFVQSPTVSKEAAELPYAMPEKPVQAEELVKVAPKPSAVKAAVAAAPLDPLTELKRLQARLNSTIGQVRALARPMETPQAPAVTPAGVTAALAQTKKTSKASKKQKDWHKRRALGSLGANAVGVAWH